MPTHIAIRDLLDSHDDRIERLEGVLMQIGPTVARIDERLEAMASDLEELKVSLKEVEDSACQAGNRDQQRETRLVTLETELKETKERRKAIAKWVAGVVSAVIVAVVVTLLGIG